MTSKNCDFCNFSKNCKKLEKSQFLVKLLNSSGKGGRKVPSKNCDLCNFCDYYHDKELTRKIVTDLRFFTTHEIKSQFLLLRGNLDISGETGGSVRCRLQQHTFSVLNFY